MLAKLKIECGFQFTKKMEGMFHDMKLSSEVMSAYRDHITNTTVRSITCCPASANVLIGA
jgi:cullin 3